MKSGRYEDYRPPSASEALGRPISKLYSIRWRRHEEQVAEESELRENGEWRGEKEHPTQNGRALRVETRVTLMREIPGIPRGRLAVIRDVTERNQHEDKVRVSEIRYRRLFEAAHDKRRPGDQE